MSIPSNTSHEYCPNCGAAFTGKINFCRQCGESLKSQFDDEATSVLTRPLKDQNKSMESVPSKTDVDFAKTALLLLLKGDASVIEMIDWENFIFNDTSVGNEVRLVPSKRAKEMFIKLLVEFTLPTRLSESLKEDIDVIVRDFPNILSNWREDYRDADETVVSVDRSGGSILKFR